MSVRELTQDEINLVYGYYPDHPTTAAILVRLTDDRPIKELLMRADRLTALEPRPGLTEKINYRVYWGDESYFYCVVRYVGHAKPEDNGYVAYLIDRKSCSVRDAHKLFTRLSDQNATGPDVLEEIRAVKTEEN